MSTLELNKNIGTISDVELKITLNNSELNELSFSYIVTKKTD
jgi:hypothetical protein